jgi:hypothetical protein
MFIIEPLMLFDGYRLFDHRALFHQRDKFHLHQYANKWANSPLFKGMFQLLLGNKPYLLVICCDFATRSLSASPAAFGRSCN